MVVRETDDRGQLLLVGGIAIALVVLGGVVLLNGMLFTDNIGARDNADAMKDAQRTLNMMEGDLRQLTERVREETTLGNFESAIEDNLTTYRQHYTNLSFDSGVVYTDIELNSTAAENGVYLQRSGSNDPSEPCNEQFGGPMGSTQLPTFEYDPTNNGDPCQDLYVEGSESIKQFNFTIRRFPCQPDGGSTDTNLTVHINSSDGSAYWNVRFVSIYTGPGSCNADGNSPGDAIRYVEIYNSSEGHITSYDDTEPWFPDAGPMEVDIHDGTIEGQPIPALDSWESVDKPFEIKLQNHGGETGGAEKALGTYGLWTDGTPPTDIDSPTPDRPLTILAVDIVYQRPELRYNRTIVLDGED